jgi:hypothetical protein
VEAFVALSIVYVAADNFRVRDIRGRWWLAGLFGLVHGFGFASVLMDLGLPQGSLVLALVGFNLGVEIGQLALVAAFLPFAFLFRETTFYRRVLVVGGSAAIVVIAAFLAGRAFARREARRQLAPYPTASLGALRPCTDHLAAPAMIPVPVPMARRGRVTFHEPHHARPHVSSRWSRSRSSSSPRSARRSRSCGSRCGRSAPRSTSTRRRWTTDTS